VGVDARSPKGVEQRIRKSADDGRLIITNFSQEDLKAAFFNTANSRVRRSVEVYLAGLESSRAIMESACTLMICVWP